MFKTVMTVTLSCLLVACAGMNPNVGETTTDRAWNVGDFSTAYTTAKPYAEQGQPWAQLRLGIFYANGWGVEKDASQAVAWYQKASVQMAEGDWAEGKTVGATGKTGYFNQNSDALIAKFNLAEMYFRGEGVAKDLDKSLSLVEEVIAQSNGKPVFFCCEFSEPRYFNPPQFEALKAKILAQKSALQ
ncbi:tetratricopeptide repeat protein [Vibrio panuliri]|uniref:Hemagglutinin protein n=1 Tax=Vibrio panuliri TaxID=1381081 RepID=A0ABX3FN98_9VIBR|nr:SEL1-like repeat protein [Vibrio panuliri]KAB1454867.1 sel1 repeat family protein [Vibrio panuliri]OLQ95235.1 hemagglutinin protein [Vibrio panuliri]